MKNKKPVNKHVLTALSISLLTSSSLAMSANYNLLEHQNNASDVNQMLPLNNELRNSPSILDSFQQEEINQKKANYLNVINLIKQNKTKEAKDKIASLLKKAPREAEYYNLQGLLELSENKPDAAQQSYKKALEINPNNLLAHFSLAKLYLDAGELDKAQDHANKAIAINSKNIPAYLVLADVAYQQKKYAEVETVLVTAHEKIKGDINAEIEVINNLAKFHNSQKQPEKTLALSEDLVKRYPGNSQAMSMLAGAQIVNNKKDLAEQTLRQLIHQEQKNTVYRLLLAKFLSEQPDKEKAVIELLDEVIAIEPKKTEAIALKTAYLIQLQRYPEALALAEKTEAQSSALGKALKGDVYLAEKKLAEALENYQHAYKEQPNDKVLFAIVDLLTVQNQLPQAISLLDKALEKNPKNSEIQFKLATVYLQLKDNAKAEHYYKAILEKQPENILTLNNLAWLYAQQNKPQALELAKKAYDKAPELGVIADTYGYILIKQGHSAEGLAALEKAVGLAPNAKDIQFHLAEAYVANNNKAKAIELLEKITTPEQKFSEKKAAIALLEKLKL